MSARRLTPARLSPATRPSNTCPPAGSSGPDVPASQYSAFERKQLLEAWENSGQTAVVFAREHPPLSPNWLFNWRWMRDRRAKLEVALDAETNAALAVLAASLRARGKDATPGTVAAWIIRKYLTRAAERVKVRPSPTQEKNDGTKRPV